jgi:Flp pilus assembly protein TadB
MLRFLVGILIVQMASVVLVLTLRPENGEPVAWWPVGLAILTIAVVAAFWFANLATLLRRDELERLRSEFAREREELKVKAERDKTRLIKQSQKTMLSETRRAEARANLKVGAALAGAVGVGALMIFANFMTLGLLLMTAAGSALGGYLLRREVITRYLPRSPGLRLPSKSVRRTPPA